MEDWAQAFWGKNYAELLLVKSGVDPQSLLNCWHCVGWNQSEDINIRAFRAWSANPSFRQHS